MKRKIVTYTSTLPSMVMEDVVEYATKKNISKNKVIEIAIKMLMEEEIKNELKESFRKISKDPEMVEMAEWGMNEYSQQLKDFDK